MSLTSIEIESASESTSNESMHPVKTGTTKSPYPKHIWILFSGQSSFSNPLLVIPSVNSSDILLVSNSGVLRPYVSSKVTVAVAQPVSSDPVISIALTPPSCPVKTYG